MRLSREEFTAICKEYLPIWKKEFPSYAHYKSLSDDTLKIIYNVYKEDDSWDAGDYTAKEVAQYIVDTWSEIPVPVMNEFFKYSAKEDKITAAEARLYYNNEGGTFKKGTKFIVNCEVLSKLDAKDTFYDATGYPLPYTESSVDF